MFNDFCSGCGEKVGCDQRADAVNSSMRCKNTENEKNMNRNETSYLSYTVSSQLALMKFKGLRVRRNNFHSQKETGTNKSSICRLFLGDSRGVAPAAGESRPAAQSVTGVGFWVGRSDSSLLHLDFTSAPGGIPGAPRGVPRCQQKEGQRGASLSGSNGHGGVYWSLSESDAGRYSRYGFVNLWTGKAGRRREALGEPGHDPHRALTTTEES